MRRREWKVLVERAMREEVPQAWDKYWELEAVHQYPEMVVTDQQVMAAVQMHGQALNGDWRMEEVEQVWWWLRRTNVAYTTTHSTAGGRAW